MESANKEMPQAIHWTPSQDHAIRKIKDFIADSKAKVFILTGSAGTGKTTLTKAIIKELQANKKNFSLLASTGRAAKVVKNATKECCSTVHSLLYTFKGFNQDLEKLASVENGTQPDKFGQLLIVFDTMQNPDGVEKREHFYIVDESSMISDTPDRNPSQATFGSGRLLSDLLAFNPKGKFIFIGDICQLPPINATSSPALSCQYIQNTYHVSTAQAELKDIVRQKDTNDIIIAAQKIRKLYENPPVCKWGKFPLKNFRHIKVHNSQADLISSYIQEIKTNGYDETILITQSNRQSYLLSQLIRPALGLSDATLQLNDLLLITQNNLISGLMNGDMVKVTQIGKSIQKAGLSFQYIEVEEVVTKRKYSQYLIMEILHAQGQTNLTQTQQTFLFIDFFQRMKRIGIHPKKNPKSFQEEMRRDPFLNALRGIYGYAITCHKAQGGEWKEVYLDIPKKLSFQPTQNNYQWLYTAVTRARENLHIAEDFFLCPGNTPLEKTTPTNHQSSF